MNKSIYYFSNASKNTIIREHMYSRKILLKEFNLSNWYVEAHFAVGYFYYEDKYVDKNIKKSIYLYKEASSFDNQNKKNNFGVIYKNGFGIEILQKIWFSTTYFEEAIRQKNDKFSMHNLSHIYIYIWKTGDGIAAIKNESLNYIIKNQLILKIQIQCMNMDYILYNDCINKKEAACYLKNIGR